jgi:K+:H+ antiporter
MPLSLRHPMLFASHNFLEDLALVLCVAAATTVIFHVLRQPVVVGYLLAGMMVGPHVPIPLLVDSHRIHIISELGVILLMFALGLEFSIRKLARLGPTAGFVCALQVGLMLWLGYLCGQALGWTELESIFTGALLSISSTTIVAKAYEDVQVGERVRELVFGVLLAEDLTAVMLLAVLTALASGAGLSTRMMASTVGRLAGFLAALVGIGLLVVPRLMRWIVRLGRAETTLVASIGICFAFAIIAQHAGYSVALGAFLAGSLVAESGEAHAIEGLIAPVRDMFAAIFFVSVGMLIDPPLIATHWVALVVLTVVVIAGKLVGVTAASMLSGNGVHTSVRAGMSLMQIGEFSFIIAGLGLEMHATRDFLYTLAVAVSAITTFSTPFAIRASGAVAGFAARRLPDRIGAFESLYDAWMERMRRGAPADARGLAGPIAAIGAAAVAFAAILIVNELDPLDLTGAVERALGVTYFRAGLLVDLGALAVCAAPVAALWFSARALAERLATRALPDGVMPWTTAAGPVQALAEMLHATILVVVGMPTLALVQPFVGPLEGTAAAVIGTVLVAIAVWRSARQMSGQMRAIARLIADAIAGRHAPAERVAPEIPGLGEMTAVKLAEGAAAVGSTLADLKLRAATGATVVAISREEIGVVVPDPREVLRAGDVLELAGASDAVAAAAALLTAPSAGAAQPQRAG